MNRQLIIFSMAIFVTSGCQSGDSGTSTGNPLVKVTMTASSAAATNIALKRPSFISPWFMEILKPALALPLPAMVDSSGLTVSLSDAWVAVQEVELKTSELTESEEVDGSEVSFPGPFAVNLLASNPDSFGQVRLTKSTIRRIKMKLHKTASLPSDAPGGLSNRSIYWSGTVDGQALVFASSEEQEYESAGPYGVALADNSNVLLSIQIASLVKKIDLSGFKNSPPAAGLIDEAHRYATAGSKCPGIDASASDLYSCFRKGLSTESKLGRDDDGNDELDSGEDSVD